MSWQEISLGDAVKEDGGILQTGPFGSQLKQSEYAVEGVPVIMPKDIRNGEVIQEEVARVPEATAERLARHRVSECGIVLPRRGEVSKRAFIKPEQAGWICGTGCLKIEVGGVKVWPRFLYYYLALPSSVDWLLQNAVGSTMLNLSVEIVSRFPLRLPSIDVQKKLAENLSNYDEAIENNQRRIQLLEESARLLFREWFVHLRFPGHEHVKVINGVPEGWSFQSLEKIAGVVMGQSPKSEFYNEDGDGLPFHQGVTGFGLRYPEHKTYCTVTKRLAKTGDILFSVRAPVGRINLANDKIVVGRGIAAIKSKLGQQNFLHYALKSHFFKEDMIGGGAIFASVSKKDLLGVKLLQPEEPFVRLFMDHVKPIDEQIDILTRANKELAKARDLLLPKLMSGEFAA